MLKTDIINLLGREHGFASYLEICTPTTGNLYAEVDRRQYMACRRLAYRCPGRMPDPDDWDILCAELEIDEPSIAAVLATAPYDLILVDSWHSREASLRDLRLALRLLAPAGVIVVHDCSPPALALTSPDFLVGKWCGQTYAALIDFMGMNPDVEGYTVATDFGCGVLRRRTGTAPPPAADPLWRAAWKALRGDWQAQYRFFDSRRSELLGLVSVAEFLVREGLRPSAR